MLQAFLLKIYLKYFYTEWPIVLPPPPPHQWCSPLTITCELLRDVRRALWRFMGNLQYFWHSCGFLLPPSYDTSVWMSLQEQQFLCLKYVRYNPITMTDKALDFQLSEKCKRILNNGLMIEVGCIICTWFTTKKPNNQIQRRLSKTLFSQV